MPRYTAMPRPEAMEPPLGILTLLMPQPSVRVAMHQTIITKALSWLAEVWVKL